MESVEQAVRVLGHEYQVLSVMAGERAEFVRGLYTAFARVCKRGITQQKIAEQWDCVRNLTKAILYKN